MSQNPPCPTGEGCQARARQKKDYKGAVEASPKDRSMVVTMDHVNIQDFDYAAGMVVLDMVLCAAPCVQTIGLGTTSYSSVQ